MRSRISNRTAAVLASIATAAVVAVPAMAQDTGTPDNVPATAEEREEAREARREHAQELLAAELGIPVEELQEAMDAVHEQLQAERLAALRERLDEKVAAGDLTEEEADEIYARAEAGEWPRRGNGRHGRGPGGRFGAGGPGGPGGASDGTADATAA